MFSFSLIDESLLSSRRQLQVMPRCATKTIKPTDVWGMVKKGTLIGWADSRNVVMDRHRNYWAPKLDELSIRPGPDHLNALYHVPHVGLMMSVVAWPWMESMADHAIQSRSAPFPVKEYYLLDAVFRGCPACFKEMCGTPSTCFSLTSGDTIPLERNPDLIPYADPMANVYFSEEDDEDLDFWGVSTWQGETLAAAESRPAFHKMRYKSASEAHSFAQQAHRSGKYAIIPDELDDDFHFNGFFHDEDFTTPKKNVGSNKKHKEEPTSFDHDSYNYDCPF